VTEQASLPERREVGVMLVDLFGFSAFVETAEPERTFATLAEYHAAVTPVVERHGGAVMDMVGDGVCVTFNGVTRVPEPELATVRAALELRSSLAEVVRTWKKRGDALDFRIGVSFGYATVGTVRVADRSEPRVIGSTVHVAARLCSAASRGAVFATERLVNAAESIATGTRVDGVSLAGLRRPPVVFELEPRGR